LTTVAARRETAPLLARFLLRFRTVFFALRILPLNRNRAIALQSRA
jgi:hypothetical protein